ncbi:hypothetical protein WMF28_04290 [Sorangium sp. So ce590]|uniref:hypothetical protein n=1 Tax=Sorangium sp. So ce590 TaxID=3133317 RepID=UPI003F63C9EC
MGAVVAMLHAGLRCAFPAQQVLLAEGGPAPERGACLWGSVDPGNAGPHRAARAAPEPATRSVRLSTGGGAQAIACAFPRLVEVDREHVWPLPELLAELLAMPHVVGLAEIDGALHWVIDARRLRDAGA